MNDQMKLQNIDPSFISAPPATLKVVKKTRPKTEKPTLLVEQLRGEVIWPIKFRGRLFDSQADLAKHYSVTSQKIGLRLKFGWTLEQTLNLDPVPWGTEGQNKYQAHLAKQLARQRLRLQCKKCGKPLVVKTKGVIPTYCDADACLKGRAAEHVRKKLWKAKGLEDRPVAVQCIDCGVTYKPAVKAAIRKRCTDCIRIHRNKQQVDSRKKNPERHRLYKNRCYAKHAEKYREYGKQYGKERYAAKREELLEASNARYKKNPEKYRKIEQQRRSSGVVSARDRKRYRANVQYRIQKVIRARLRPLLIGKIKAGSAVDDLGMSISNFRMHIESLWVPEMSWENYGSLWDLDHIFPLSKSDLTDRVQFLAVCNWRNYRPLWDIDNHAKKARVTKEAQSLFDSLCKRFARAAFKEKPPRDAGKARV